MSGLSPVEAQNVAASMVRYRKDFRAFAQEQLHLGQGPMRFWPCQMPLIESIERQFAERGFARCVWLKARQVGASTLAQCFVAWRTMLWPNVNAIVIADESERARTLFEISRGFYDHMDAAIRPVGRYVTKRELVFANPSHITRARDPGLRSRIVVDSAHKKNIAIGAAWTVAHLSEAARFRDPNVVLDGVIPAVHMVPGTLIIIESSAEMAGTWYRDFCEEAQRGKNAFEFSFVPWFLQPEYFVCPICRRIFPQVCLDPIGHAKEGLKRLDVSPEERHLMAEYKLQPGHINWMRGKFSEFGNDWNLFRQNYPITPEDAWITPGVQVFPSKQLKMFREMAQPPKRLCEVHAGPRILDSPHGRLKIWKEPEASRSYDIGVDVASGVGEDDETSSTDLDNSVACVIERGNNEQVAEWVSRSVDPYELATTLYWLGKYYHDGQVAIETNAIGGATNAQLAKLGYSNQYLWRYRDEIVPRYSKKTGWETNPRSKPWLVGFAVHEAVNGRVIIRSELLVREMEAFVQQGPREWGAVAGTHDDRVMAWMIGLLASDDENFERYYGLRREVDGRAEAGPQKRKPNPWEADLTFGKNMEKEDNNSPWE